MVTTSCPAMKAFYFQSSSSLRRKRWNMNIIFIKPQTSLQAQVADFGMPSWVAFVHEHTTVSRGITQYIRGAHQTSKDNF